MKQLLLTALIASVCTPLAAAKTSKRLLKELNNALMVRSKLKRVQEILELNPKIIYESYGESTILNTAIIARNREALGYIASFEPDFVYKAELLYIDDMDKPLEILIYLICKAKKEYTLYYTIFESLIDTLEESKKRAITKKESKTKVDPKKIDKIYERIVKKAQKLQLEKIEHIINEKQMKNPPIPKKKQKQTRWSLTNPLFPLLKKKSKQKLLL